MFNGITMTKAVADKTNDPPPHRLDIKDRLLWYCAANKG